MGLIDKISIVGETAQKVAHSVKGSVLETRENLRRFNIERVKKEELYFYNPDDPIYHKDLIIFLSRYLRGNIQEAFLKNILDHLIDLENNTKNEDLLLDILKKAIQSENYTVNKKKYIYNLKNVRYADIVKIYLNTLFDPSVKKDIPIDLLQEVSQNLAKAVGQSLKSFFVKSSEIYQGQNTFIYSDQSVNGLTLWYTKQSFLNLEMSISQLIVEPKGTENIISLLTLGLALGYFEKEHPDREYNIQVLKRYASFNYLPPYLKDLLSKENIANKTTTRLQSLKNFWREYFVHAFVAKNSTVAPAKELTTLDYQKGSHGLKKDTRLADDISGIEKIIERIQKRTGRTNIGAIYIQEYEKETAKLEQQKKSTKEKLLSYLNEIIKKYNPNHKFLVNNNLEPEAEWVIFREKAHSLLELFVKNIHPFLKKGQLSLSEEQNILDKTAEMFIKTIETGSDIEKKFKLDIKKLFGDNFDKLSSIEKVAIIVFSALSLCKENKIIKPAVEIISFAFNDILQKHTDKEIIKIVSKNTSIPLYDNFVDVSDKEIQQARSKLKTITRNIGLLSIDTTEYQNEEKAKKKLLIDIYKILDKRGYLGIFFSKNWPSFIKTITPFTIIASGLIQNIPIGTSIGLIMLTIDSIYRSFNKMKLNPHSEKISTFEEYDILYDNLNEAIHEIKKEIESTKSKRLQKFVYELIATLSIGTLLLGANAYKKDIWDSFTNIIQQEGANNSTIDNDDYKLSYDEVQNLPQYEDILYQYPIPEKLKSESLRNLEFLELGDVYHVPSNLYFSENMPIGFYTKTTYDDFKLFEFFDEFIQSTFTNIEYVDSLNENTHNPEADELVYLVENNSKFIKALDEYQIVKIYRVHGNNSTISILDSGHLINSQEVDFRNEKIIIVAKKIPNRLINESIFAVRENNGVVTEGYDPWYANSENSWPEDQQKALEINNLLKDDPDLQNLHSKMIFEVDQLYRDHSSDIYDTYEVREKYSEIATKYSLLFAEYIKTNRTYSLNFEMEKNNMVDTALVSIAKQPNVGFYCSVANISFQDFMATIKIDVRAKIGYHIYLNNGKLFYRIGHLNSLVMLPNGKTLNTDMTPTNPNPGEDLSALDNPEFPNEAEQTPFTDIFYTESFKTLLTIVVGTASVVGSVVVAKKTPQLVYSKLEQMKQDKKDKKKSKAINDLEKIFKNNTVVDADVKKSLFHILTYVLEIQSQNSQIKFGPNEPFKTKSDFLELLAKDAFTFSNYLNNDEDITTNLERSKNLNIQITTMEFSHKQILNLKESLIIIRRELIKTKIEMITSLQKKLVELQKQIKEEKKLATNEDQSKRQEKINKIDAEIEKIKNKIILISAFSQQLNQSLNVFINA